MKLCRFAVYFLTAVCSVPALTACGTALAASGSYYSSYESGFMSGGRFELSGTAHVDGKLSAAYFHALEDAQVQLHGTFTSISGSFQLVYINDSGSVQVVCSADGSEEKTVNADLSLPVQAGDGRLEFRGEDVSMEVSIEIDGIGDAFAYFAGERPDENPWEIVSEDADEEEPVEAAHGTEPETEAGAGAKPGEGSETISAKVKASQKGVKLLTFNCEEPQTAMLTVRMSAENDRFSVFNGYRLLLRDENGKNTLLSEDDSKRLALGDYEWETEFSEEISLPAGTSWLVFDGSRMSNVLISVEAWAE